MWKVVHMTKRGLLLQDGPHSALVAADSLHYCTICEVQIFLQVYDLPTLTLGELTLAPLSHCTYEGREKTSSS